MKLFARRPKPAGFSLIELLMVVGVIGIIAAMVIPAIGGLWERGESAKDRRNAQTLVHTFSAARSAGATFTVSTKQAIAEVLSGNAGGKPITGQGVFATTSFLVALSPEEVGHALTYIEAQGEGENLVLSLILP